MAASAGQVATTSGEPGKFLDFSPKYRAASLPTNLFKEARKGTASVKEIRTHAFTRNGTIGINQWDKHGACELENSRLFDKADLWNFLKKLIISYLCVPFPSVSVLSINAAWFKCHLKSKEDIKCVPSHQPYLFYAWKRPRQRTNRTSCCFLLLWLLPWTQ